MPYTFGAATADDIGWAGAGLQQNRMAVVTGWWRPTTLTATRGLWSNGNIIGAEIDTTTDELRLRADNATTDGQWTTTGVDLVVDEWKFLAFIVSLSNTGPSVAWRVYAGDIQTAPQPATVAVAVAMVGALPGANNTIYVGNKGTSTLAFQGDIAQFSWLMTGSAAGAAHPLGVAAYGSITDLEAQFIYEYIIAPSWLGQPLPRLRGSYVGHVSLNLGALVEQYTDSAAAPTTVATVNGATVSLNGEPRPTYNPDAFAQYVRR